jgi:hypothetical protein
MTNRSPLQAFEILAGILVLLIAAGFASAQTEPSQNSVPVMLKITDYPGEWPDSVPVPIGLVNMGGTKLKKNKHDHLVLYQTFFPDLSETASENPGKDYILAYTERLKQAGFKQTNSHDKPDIMNLSLERGKYKIDIAYSLINTPTSKEQIEISFEFLNNSP